MSNLLHIGMCNYYRALALGSKRKLRLVEREIVRLKVEAFNGKHTRKTAEPKKIAPTDNPSMLRLVYPEILMVPRNVSAQRSWRFSLRFVFGPSVRAR